MLSNYRYTHCVIGSNQFVWAYTGVNRQDATGATTKELRLGSRQNRAWGEYERATNSCRNKRSPASHVICCRRVIVDHALEIARMLELAHAVLWQHQTDRHSSAPT
jgi:hypothetical protein